MVDFISDSSWEALEARVLEHIPLGSVNTEREFKKQLASKFFQGEYGEVTHGQQRLADTLWGDLKDEYGVEEEAPERIEINFREYPKEAKRFVKAMALYHGILKLFNRGYHRKQVVKYYSHHTKRKTSTVQRDISSLVKVGVIFRRVKRRGYYRAKSNIYV